MKLIEFIRTEIDRLAFIANSDSDNANSARLALEARREMLTLANKGMTAPNLKRLAFNRRAVALEKNEAALADAWLDTIDTINFAG